MEVSMFNDKNWLFLRASRARAPVAALLCALTVALPRTAQAQAFDNYQLTGNFTLPGSGGPMGGHE
jgi:hypothetical protein